MHVNFLFLVLHALQAAPEDSLEQTLPRATASDGRAAAASDKGFGGGGGGAKRGGQGKGKSKGSKKKR